MNAAKKLRSAKTHLAILKEEVSEIEDYINELESECRNMDVRLQKTDIAEFLGCSARTVTRMLDDGRLASTKMIDVWKFKQVK